MAKKKGKYDVRSLLSNARAKKQSALNAEMGTVFRGTRRAALAHFDKIIWLCGQLQKARRELKSK